MSTSAVRVLPSSRPEPRTWLAQPVRPEPARPEPISPGPVPGDTEPAVRPQPGRVERVGRGWAARVPDDLPDAARWSGWFSVALGEALLGRRPATQLAGWVSDEVLAALSRRQRLRPAEELAPRMVLLSGRVQHPASYAAEASAVLRAGPRLLVMAFRLEAVERQWVCTGLDAGLTPAPRRPARVATTAVRPAGG